MGVRASGVHKNQNKNPLGDRPRRGLLPRGFLIQDETVRPRYSPDLLPVNGEFSLEGVWTHKKKAKTANECSFGLNILNFLFLEGQRIFAEGVWLISSRIDLALFQIGFSSLLWIAHIQ